MSVSLASPQGKIWRSMIVGDLHISDKYSGRHVDYFRDCTEFLEQVTNKMKEMEVTHLILTGDLVGRTTEKNLQSRESLLYFMKVLQVWNNITNGNVYTLRGNHDISSKLTDFDLFLSLGLIKMIDSLDVGGIRFHFFNYGEHNRPIQVAQDRYNVAVMHTHLKIEGVTTWFNGGPDGVELSSLENLYGVDFVVAGHIHNPSVRMVETSIRDKTIQLFYPGNGTRPRFELNLWTKCYAVMFETNENFDVMLKLIEFPLRPIDEVFQKTYEDVETEELIDSAPMFDIDQLSNILEELKNYNILGESDYKSQITRLGGLDKEAVELALNYIELVEREMK